MSEATGTRAQRGTAAHPISSVCPRDGEDKKVVSGSPGLRGCATGHPRPGGHSPWVAAGAVGERRAAFPGPMTCAVRASARDGAASCLARLTFRRAGPQAAGPFCGTPAFSPPRRLSRPGAECSCSPLTAPWLPSPDDRRFLQAGPPPNLTPWNPFRRAVNLSWKGPGGSSIVAQGPPPPATLCLQAGGGHRFADSGSLLRRLPRVVSSAAP